MNNAFVILCGIMVFSCSHVFFKNTRNKGIIRILALGRFITGILLSLVLSPTKFIETDFLLGIFLGAILTFGFMAPESWNFPGKQSREYWFKIFADNFGYKNNEGKNEDEVEEHD